MTRPRLLLVMTLSSILGFAAVACSDDEASPGGKGGEGGSSHTGGTGGTAGAGGSGGEGGAGGSGGEGGTAGAGGSGGEGGAGGSGGSQGTGGAGGSSSAACSSADISDPDCQDCLIASADACPNEVMVCLVGGPALTCAMMNGCVDLSTNPPGADLTCVFANCMTDILAAHSCMEDCPAYAACFP